jgi:hypothetical protein
VGHTWTYGPVEAMAVGVKVLEVGNLDKSLAKDMFSMDL